MFHELSDYYLRKDEPAKSCLLTLRDIILMQDIHISETVKYGMPCFYYKKKMFCYLWTDKKTNKPYILMVDGKHLNNPGLEQGKRSQMKVFRINPNIDIPLQEVEQLINDALDLYRNGTLKVKN